MHADRLFSFLTIGMRGFVFRNILALLTIFIFEFAVMLAAGRPLSLTALILITSFYAWILFHNKVLLTLLYNQRQYLLYGVLVLLGISIATWLECFFLARSFERSIMWQYACWAFVYTLFGTACYFTFRYVIEKREWYQLNILKKEIELENLKTQLNPHFLFNALNNIYSYNLENNTYGNDLILKLSQLVRFHVEAAPQPTISVSAEIMFIKNYLSFEQEQVGHRCEIRFMEEVRHPQRQIPPLVLFPFIENAFKHGTNSNQKTSIDIEIKDSSTSLELFVRNKIVSQFEGSTRTGLSNIKRRLDLLFPEKHLLQISQSDGYYLVNLYLSFE